MTSYIIGRALFTILIIALAVLAIVQWSRILIATYNIASARKKGVSRFEAMSLFNWFCRSEIYEPGHWDRIRAYWRAFLGFIVYVAAMGAAIIAHNHLYGDSGRW